MNTNHFTKNLQLKGFDLEFSGNGGIISYQSPESGTRVLEGSSIRLLLTE